MQNRRPPAPSPVKGERAAVKSAGTSARHPPPTHFRPPPWQVGSSTSSRHGQLDKSAHCCVCVMFSACFRWLLPLWHPMADNDLFCFVFKQAREIFHLICSLYTKVKKMSCELREGISACISCINHCIYTCIAQCIYTCIPQCIYTSNQFAIIIIKIRFNLLKNLTFHCNINY